MKELTPEEAAKLARLHIEHAEISAFAGRLARDYGMQSRQFAVAEGTAGMLLTEIRKLLGEPDQNWMN